MLWQRYAHIRIGCMCLPLYIPMQENASGVCRRRSSFIVLGRAVPFMIKFLCSVLVQMQKLEKAHNAERNGLKEKLERLQRANKQRRGEVEDMQAKLSSMHSRASAYDQAICPVTLHSCIQQTSAMYEC